ncbi:hypothetical protein F900_03036 [Acinetobacter modestus]|uniref:Uncharacterized protein n=1 Tax=Acinetobacter modestus TaxID=1776740 RepID=N9LRU7_9GAMM|nr:hypothetical protein F900_03036 [Acinetobacter modestus]
MYERRIFISLLFIYANTNYRFKFDFFSILHDVSLLGVSIGLLFLLKDETQHNQKLYIAFAICTFFIILTNLVLK